MSLRFNGGHGAYTCDGCQYILRSGWRRDDDGKISSWSTINIASPVVLDVGDGRTREFCRRGCVIRCSKDRNEDPIVRAACRVYLAKKSAT